MKGELTRFVYKVQYAAYYMQVLFKAQILIITQNSQGLRITNLSLFWAQARSALFFTRFIHILLVV